MKQLYLSIMLAAVVVGQAHARIGFTLDECRKAYGKEVKSEVAWSSPDQRAYGFKSQGLYIYVILSAEGKVVDISYFKSDGKTSISPEQRAQLSEFNVDRGRVWDDTFYRSLALKTGWNGRKTYKKLGQESGPIYVLREANGPNALVENAKGLGWQIRTMDQFELEQRAMKQQAAREKQQTPAKTGIKAP